MTIVSGTYVDRKLNVLKLTLNGVENNFFMYSNRVTDVYLIDIEEETVRKTSVADLKNGDKVMLRHEYAAINDAFVIR